MPPRMSDSLTLLGSRRAGRSLARGLPAACHSFSTKESPRASSPGSGPALIFSEAFRCAISKLSPLRWKRSPRRVAKRSVPPRHAPSRPRRWTLSARAELSGSGCSKPFGPNENAEARTALNESSYSSRGCGPLHDSPRWIAFRPGFVPDGLEECFSFPFLDAELTHARLVLLEPYVLNSPFSKQTFASHERKSVCTFDIYLQ